MCRNILNATVAGSLTDGEAIYVYGVSIHRLCPNDRFEKLTFGGTKVDKPRRAMKLMVKKSLATVDQNPEHKDID